MIGFCIVGKEKDRASAQQSDKRWEKLRPTVAFAAQRAMELRRLVLCYQVDDEELLQGIRADIAECRDGRPTLAIEPRLLELEDPFDFREVLEALLPILREASRGESASVLANMNTGTHAMSFALYVIAQKQLAPLRLVQVSVGEPGSGTPEAKREANTSGAALRELALWTPVAPHVEKLRDEAYRDLVLVQPASERLRDTFRELARIGAETHEPVLLLGPTGTGKSRIARALHDRWARHFARTAPPFEAVNCAALAPELAQSQLFGHKRGAFTGAVKDTVGAVERANRGTLFLDEIGELDPSTQAMLLRVLETKLFRPLGASQELRSEFRLICATNRNLAEEVRARHFREDLFARIRTWVYRLPGLTERLEDLDSNLDHELRAWWEEDRDRRSLPRFTLEARRRYDEFARSAAASWAGNFRDLSQSVRRLATLAGLEGDGAPITVDHVAHECERLEQVWRGGGAPDGGELYEQLRGFAQGGVPLLNAVHRLLIAQTLRETGGNKAKASRILYGDRGKGDNATMRLSRELRQLGMLG